MLEQNLMPIGRFSKACRLSIKALRYYDEQGLLKPAYIDPDTSYRYYGRHQAREAIMINMLRDIDIPVSRIKLVLQAKPIDLVKLLNQEQQRLSNELQQRQLALQSIQRLANAGEVFPYKVNIRHESSHTVAKLTMQSDASNMIKDGGYLINKLYDKLQKAGLDYKDPVMCINEDPDKQENIVVHACIGVDESLPKSFDVDIITVPSCLVAWLDHYGAYEELGLAYHALSAWVQEHGHTQHDAMREIYLNDPAITPTDKLHTQVLMPLQPS